MGRRPLRSLAVLFIVVGGLLAQSTPASAAPGGLVATGDGTLTTAPPMLNPTDLTLTRGYTFDGTFTGTFSVGGIARIATVTCGIHFSELGTALVAVIPSGGGTCSAGGVDLGFGGTGVGRRVGTQIQLVFASATLCLSGTCGSGPLTVLLNVGLSGDVSTIFTQTTFFAFGTMGGVFA